VSQAMKSRWERLRTPESRLVEELLREEFPNADAYRYNSASIRVRVIDERFHGLSQARRDAKVERLLKQLPPEIQNDIVNLITLTPEEALPESMSLVNLEFERPSRSHL
jgi:stress-induced morphogen